MFNRRSELVRHGDWFDPYAMFTRLAPEFTELFGDTARPTFRTRARTESMPSSPKLDVFERENRLIARIDLPGTKKEEMKVEVVDGWLTIFGERKHETDEEKENFYRREREYGTFYRALPLPEGANVEEVVSPPTADWRSRSEDDLVIEARILKEYAEMPGLSLTLPQAARLFNLDMRRCAHLLEDLILDGALWTDRREFLGRNMPGRYL